MDMAGDRSDWATEGYSAWLHKTRIFETLGSEDWWEERDQVCEWVSIPTPKRHFPLQDQNAPVWEHPGGPVVRTPCFHS